MKNIDLKSEDTEPKEKKIEELEETLKEKENESNAIKATLLNFQRNIETFNPEK